MRRPNGKAKCAPRPSALATFSMPIRTRPGSSSSWIQCESRTGTYCCLSYCLRFLSRPSHYGHFQSMPVHGRPHGRPSHVRPSSQKAARGTSWPAMRALAVRFIPERPSCIPTRINACASPPDGRAVCEKSARTDLCRGQAAMPVPTATAAGVSLVALVTPGAAAMSRAPARPARFRPPYPRRQRPDGSPRKHRRRCRAAAAPWSHRRPGRGCALRPGRWRR